MNNGRLKVGQYDNEDLFIYGRTTLWQRASTYPFGYWAISIDYTNGKGNDFCNYGKGNVSGLLISQIYKTKNDNMRVADNALKKMHNEHYIKHIPQIKNALIEHFGSKLELII